MECKRVKREIMKNGSKISDETSLHLADCADCTVFYNEFSVMEERLLELPDLTPPENFTADTLARIENKKGTGPLFTFADALSAAAIILAAAIGFWIGFMSASSSPSADVPFYEDAAYSYLSESVSGVDFGDIYVSIMEDTSDER